VKILYKSLQRNKEVLKIKRRKEYFEILEINLDLTINELLLKIILKIERKVSKFIESLF